ncbi:ATP-binding protein [Mesorhizobium sp. 1M-11]|uniref:sensor histidine kinase n=1 Tax=Mesorhizobium sp. 1M-11 TaxID=1529006 RepID=UPI0006C7703D|nr:ATP-binding protein [Mesorhizobium sp. 1M-11]
MNRLFRRLFLTIWLSMAGMIGTIVPLAKFAESQLPAENNSRNSPPLTLDLIENLITTDHVDTARKVAAALASVSSLRPEIDEIAVDATSRRCPTEEQHAGFDSRIIATGDRCFKIAVTRPDSAYQLFKSIFFFPLLGCVLASLLASFWLAKYLTGPIVMLKDGLHRLANGDFATRIGEKLKTHRDEVSDLARDFDVTAEKLETLHANRQRLYQDISHELRSPLSRLQVELGVLRQKPAEAGTMLARMDREIERLNTLVEQILILARLGSGVRLGSGSLVPAERQRIDVIGLLKIIAEDASFEGQKKNVDVRLSGQKTFVAEVDGELLFRAFENVIRNALNYTAAGTTVSVHASLERDQLLRVTVSDCGPGVAPEHLAEIFIPFARVGDHPSVGGHGLGLAIAKHSLELHGGRIWAQTPAEGGLVVTMEIPAFR